MNNIVKTIVSLIGINVNNTKFSIFYGSKAGCTQPYDTITFNWETIEENKLYSDNHKLQDAIATSNATIFLESNNESEMVLLVNEMSEPKEIHNNSFMYGVSQNSYTKAESYNCNNNYAVDTQQPCNSNVNPEYKNASDGVFYGVEVNSYGNVNVPQNTFFKSQQAGTSNQEAVTLDTRLSNNTPCNSQSHFALYSEKNNSSNAIFFHTTVILLKNVLYYRFNLAKFLILFNKQINKKVEKSGLENQHNVKDLIMNNFIQLSLHNAKNIERNVENDVVFIEENEHRKLKQYEIWLINEAIVRNNADILKDCKEYLAIKEHNKDYLIALNKIISRLELKRLYVFLSPFLPNFPLSKCFCMLNNLLISLYDIHSIINEKLDLNVQNYLIDIRACEVHSCCCSKEVKKHFIFHWAFCWFFYFATNCALPESNSDKSYIIFCIDYYPREFFIQFIVLVHTVINFNSPLTSNDLTLSYITELKQSIYDLLFSSKKKTISSLLYYTLLKLFKAVANIYNHPIYQVYSVANIRIIQTPKSNFILSNLLIPTLQETVNTIFNIAIEAGRRVKLVNRKVEQFN